MRRSISSAARWLVSSSWASQAGIATAVVAMSLSPRANTARVVSAGRSRYSVISPGTTAQARFAISFSRRMPPLSKGGLNKSVFGGRYDNTVCRRRSREDGIVFYRAPLNARSAISSCRIGFGDQRADGCIPVQEKPERPRWTLRLTDLRGDGGLLLVCRVRVEHKLANALLGRGVDDGPEKRERATFTVHRVLARRKCNVAARTATALPDPEANELEA